MPHRDDGGARGSSRDIRALEHDLEGKRTMTMRLVTRRRHVDRRAEAGFTLVEMLVVIAIIGLIMGLVGPRVLSSLGESKVKTAKLQIESFSSSLDLFYLDTGRYPTASEGLDALTQRPSNVPVWNGPYLKGGRVPNDPWGNSYQYRSSGERTPPYEISSFGADGREGGTGTAADISNVEQ